MPKKSKRKRRSTGRGSILLISTLLIGSAILRIGVGAGAAVAEGDFASQLLLPDSSDDGPPLSADRAEFGTLLEAINAREARIADKEEKLKVKAKALEVAQAEIERRLEALEKAEERLSKTLARAQTGAEDDLVRLTTVYENMKPKEAAALFETMEPEFAAGFLARMRPDVAAKILSGLDPQIAYSISAILAGRNALAPKS